MFVQNDWIKTGILLGVSTLGISAFAQQTIGISHRQEITGAKGHVMQVVYADLAETLVDIGKDGNGDQIYETMNPRWNNSLYVGEDCYAQYKSIVKFQIPEPPEGKQLLNVRLRVYLKNNLLIGPGTPPLEAVHAMWSMWDNNYQTTNPSQYQAWSQTYHYASGGTLIYPDDVADNLSLTVADDFSHNPIVDKGMWFEMTTGHQPYWDTKKGTTGGVTAYRLETARIPENHSLSCGQHRKYEFGKSGFYRPQLVIIWGDLPSSGSKDYASITVDTETIVRPSSKPLRIGYNVPWHSVQGITTHGKAYDGKHDIWDEDKHRIYPEIIEELKRSPGLNYRYPGGTTANTFIWTHSIGPVKNRPHIRGLFTLWRKCLFGFDEFMKMVREVKGVPLIQVNMSDPTQTPEVAANWVRYANARSGEWADKRRKNIARLGGNTQEPYKIYRWELGNELDGMGDKNKNPKRDEHGVRYGMLPDVYRVKVAKYIQAMTKAYNESKQDDDPPIEFFPHTSTAEHSKMQAPGTWYLSLFDDNSKNIDPASISGIAYHPYFDGMSVPFQNEYMLQQLSDFQIFRIPEANRNILLTENAKWLNGGHYATTGTQGVLGTGDYYITAAKLSGVREIYQHHMGSTVRMGDPIDPYPAGSFWPTHEETGFIGRNTKTKFRPRPITKATYLLNKVLKGDMYRTLSVSPSGPSYALDPVKSRGYDINAIAIVDRQERILRAGGYGSKRLLVVNRSSSRLKTRISWPTLIGGGYCVVPVALREAKIFNMITIALFYQK
jgi:hypothetical protein